jgi:hypothetical protein
LVSFPQVSPPKACIHRSSPPCYIPHPSHSRFDPRKIFGEQYR